MHYLGSFAIMADISVWGLLRIWQGDVRDILYIEGELGGDTF